MFKRLGGGVDGLVSLDGLDSMSSEITSKTGKIARQTGKFLIVNF